MPEKPQQPASIKELGIYSPDKPIVDKKDNISNKESEKKPEEPAQPEKKPISRRRKPYQDDLLDEVMGANRQIKRQAGKQEELQYFTGLEKSKAESKSAPKSRAIDAPADPE